MGWARAVAREWVRTEEVWDRSEGRAVIGKAGEELKMTSGSSGLGTWRDGGCPSLDGFIFVQVMFEQSPTGP